METTSEEMDRLVRYFLDRGKVGIGKYHRPPMTHCLRGHDQRPAGARSEKGGCNICRREGDLRKAQGLPPLPRAVQTVCQLGHDISTKESRSANGRCKICYSAQMIAYRKRRQALDRERNSKRLRPKRKGGGDNLANYVLESQLTSMALYYDTLIENETRHYLRDELREEKERELARIRSDHRRSA